MLRAGWREGREIKMNPLHCISHCLISTVQHLLTKSLRHFLQKRKLSQGAGASALAHLHHSSGREEPGPSSRQQKNPQHIFLLLGRGWERTWHYLVSPFLLSNQVLYGVNMVKKDKNRPTPKKGVEIIFASLCSKNTFGFSSTAINKWQYFICQKAID